MPTATIENLAVELLDMILGDQGLSRRDLLAFALTRKLFHKVASRHIYSRFTASSRFDSFCTAVRRNSLYAQHVRIVETDISEATHVCSFRTLFSVSNVKLQNLSVVFRDDNSMAILGEALHSPNPAIQITSLDLLTAAGKDDTADYKVVVGTLSALGTLPGLTKLSLPRFRNVRTQDVLGALHGLTLTTLNLHNPDTVSPSLPVDRLSSLCSLILSFHVNRREMLAMLRMPMVLMWKAWTSLMERNVSLSLRHPKVNYYLSVIAHIVITYARTNNLTSYRLIRWFMEGHSNGGIKSFLLQKFPSNDRDTFLAALADSVPIENLKIGVYKRDMSVSLPHYITTLSVDVVQRVSPDLLPTIIEPLSLLKHLEVRLICGDGPNKGLGCQACCTRLPFYIPQTVVNATEGNIRSIAISETAMKIVWIVFPDRIFHGGSTEKKLYIEGVELCPWYEEMTNWTSRKCAVELKIKLLRGIESLI